MAPRKPQNTDNDYRFRPLEPQENGEIRDHLDARRFWRRVGKTLAVWSAWIVGVGAGFAFLSQQIASFLRFLGERLSGGGPGP